MSIVARGLGRGAAPGAIVAVGLGLALLVAPPPPPSPAPSALGGYVMLDERRNIEVDDRDMRDLIDILQLINATRSG